MTKKRDLNQPFSKFHKNLRIPDKDKTALLEARRSVRSHLRQHLRQHFPRIKSLTQGSYAYHTLIRPNRIPPQRMDLDDGAYFCNANIAEWSAKALLNAVGSSLGELARQKGWQLENKFTCCRLIIAEDKHIDIPCYALIGEQTSEGEDSTHRSKYASLYRDANIPYLSVVPPGAVRLAHREKGWIKSDPRLVIDWVLECVRNYGWQFLRVCCYMKAWRDNQWKKSPMKSLLVMAMVERAFVGEAISQGKIGDDDAVLKTSARMMDDLKNDRCITDPSDDSICLDRALNQEEKERIAGKLGGLHRDMETALYDSGIGKQKACELMRQQFGKWFPQDSGATIAPAIVAGANSQSTTVRPVRPWAK